MQSVTPREYIEAALDELPKLVDVPMPRNETELVDTIYRLITSTKFRKYALTEAYAGHIRQSIEASVRAGRPISLMFLGGSYKLWRLDEAPEADWAELFSHMFFTQWVKPVCAVYEPGVWFDFLLDDAIVPGLNNISADDVDAYRASRQRVLDFLKPYQPGNLNMTLTSEVGLFPSKEAHDEALARNMKKYADSLPGGLPELSEAAKASIELNVKVTDEQKSDPKWREKVELMHTAYYMARDELGYYAPETNKIRAFTQPLGSGTAIAVGSLKGSIVKYWVGIGALVPRGESFRQVILSPKQLGASTFDWQDVHIDGLEGKNFGRIRIIRESN